MPPEPRDQFLQRLQDSLRDGSFVKLTLGKPAAGADPTLRNLFVRPVLLRGAEHCSFVWRHATRDLTKNHRPDAAVTEIAARLGPTFRTANLFTTAGSLQLELREGAPPKLSTGPAVARERDLRHDQAKERVLDTSSHAWLTALGVTHPDGTPRPAQADKHRQIQKFAELLRHLAGAVPAPADRPLTIADMGSGKGYLTFAAHDTFHAATGRAPSVVGVEFRPELVATCNRVARETGRAGLGFVAGTIQQAPLAQLDVLIALHACDTATDDALARGLSAGAGLLVVAPCCQKEVRPQLQAPPVLAPALRHGIFQERHAEFVTDALRALLLEWVGYETKVFEFISTEHTAKNLMIAATRRPDGQRHQPAAAQAVRDLAAFYGIRTQALARHLGFALTT